MTAWHEGFAVDRAADVSKKYNGTYFSFDNMAYHTSHINCADIAVAPANFLLTRKNVAEVIANNTYTHKRMLFVTASTVQTNIRTVFVLDSLLSSAVDLFAKNVTTEAYFYEKALGDRLPAKEKVEFKYINSYDELCFSFPPLGYINTTFGAFFIARAPNRQYRRGFCVDSIEIRQNDIFLSLISKLGLPEKPYMKAQDIDRILFPKYYSAKDAINSLASGSVYAAAITKNICLCFLPNKKYFGILYKELYVGSVKEEAVGYDINILEEAEPFREEILTFLDPLISIKPK